MGRPPPTLSHPCYPVAPPPCYPINVKNNRTPMGYPTCPNKKTDRERQPYNKRFGGSRGEFRRGRGCRTGPWGRGKSSRGGIPRFWRRRRTGPRWRRRQQIRRSSLPMMKPTPSETMRCSFSRRREERQGGRTAEARRARETLPRRCGALSPAVEKRDKGVDGGRVETKGDSGGSTKTWSLQTAAARSGGFPREIRVVKAWAVAAWSEREVWAVAGLVGLVPLSPYGTDEIS
jgi:hypothetical protein